MIHEPIPPRRPTRWVVVSIVAVATGLFVLGLFVIGFTLGTARQNRQISRLRNRVTDLCAATPDPASCVQPPATIIVIPGGAVVPPTTTPAKLPGSTAPGAATAPPAPTSTTTAPRPPSSSTAPTAPPPTSPASSTTSTSSSSTSTPRPTVLPPLTVTIPVSVTRRAGDGAGLFVELDLVGLCALAMLARRRDFRRRRS